MSFEEYQNYFLTILQEAKKYNFTYWIYDLSEFEHNSLQARIWQITVFLPKCFRELNKEIVVALIPPQNFIHKIDIKTAITATDKMDYPYELSYFTSMEKSVHWILSKQ